MRPILSLIAVAALTTASAVATAAPVLLQSSFVRANITDKGVLSSLRYDQTNTGNFPANTDYVSPGIPFEGFEVKVGGSTFANSNSGGTGIAGTTTDLSVGTDYRASWTGSNSLFTLTHVFFFDDTSQRVNIQTTLTALADLANVRVSRAVDPDPDNYSGGSASTNNQRGIASPSVPVEDFVGSLGSISGLPLGLYYNGTITHNTGIVSNCCSVTNADTYLAGGNLGNSSSGDHGIGIGFDLGDIANGGSITWSYAYVMGGSLGTIDIPGGGTVPEPGTLLLSALALLGVAGARRRSRKHEA